MWIFVALLTLLIFVTLVGHGIWVLLATIFGGEASSRRPAPKSSRKLCPRCESHLVAEKCGVCDWPAVLPREALRDSALRETLHILARFRDNKLIDGATFARVAGLLRAELIGQSQPKTAAQPATSTPQAVVSKDSTEVADDVPTLEVMAPAIPHPTLRAIPPALSPEERVRQYTTRQVRLAAEPSPPARHKPPRRQRTDLLAAFMEEKNIRWGELVGGLMIVGCSIALVISFWAKIAERPFLKFFVFNGVTAALFGLGLYSQRRWKLRTTSEALLITASLLVPLNFLAIAAFARDAAASGLLTIVGELISIALFAVLLSSAGKIVVPGGAWPLMTGTLAPSILMLLVRRFVGPESMSLAAELFGWTMVGTYAAIHAFAARNSHAGEDPSAESSVPSVFKLLGITTFATFLAMALLIDRMGDLSKAFQRFSPLVCAAGLTPLAVGLFVWQRWNFAFERSASPSEGATSAIPTSNPIAYRTAGLSIAVAGAMLLVAGVVMAWPEPLRLAATSAIAAATLIAVAFMMRLPQAHLAAMPCLVLGYLVVWHRLRGHLSWHATDPGETFGVLASGESGQAMVPMVLALAGIAWALRKIHQAADSRFLAWGAMGVAALSIAALTWFGFGVAGDPLQVAAFYGLYALAAYAAADRFKSPAALCAGAGLLFAAVAQAVAVNFASRYELALPWATVLLVDAGLMAVTATVLTRVGGSVRRDQFAPMLLAAVALVSIGAMTLLAAAVAFASPSAVLCPRFFALAAIWFLIAWTERSAFCFSAFKACLAVAVWFGVASRLEVRDWFRASVHPWLDPWTITAEGIALTLFCLGWFVVRGWSSALRRFEPPQGGTPASRVETALLRLVLVACTAVAVYAALPGVAQELSPRLAMPGATFATRVVPPIAEFEIAGIPHDHARGSFVWIWLALVVIALVVELAVRNASWNMLAVMLVASLACPLLASGWQVDVASASALRWLAAGFLLVTSSIIWYRHRLSAIAGRWNWPRSARWQEPSHDASAAILAAFVLSLLPLVAMAVYVGGAATMRHPPAADTQWWFLPMACVFVVAGIVAVVLRALVGSGSATRTVAGQAGTLLLILGVTPLVAVTLFVVAAALKQSPILGPDPNSWFARAGLATSYAVPVLVTALTLIGYAVRERSSRFALAGGLVLNLGVMAAYLLAVAKTGLKFDTILWVRLAQLNAITSAGYALAWILVPRLRLGLPWPRASASTICAAAPRMQPISRQSPGMSELLITQVCIPVSLNLLVLVPTWLAIFWNPSLALELAPIGDLGGWGAAGLALAAVVAIRAGSRTQITASEWFIVSCALGTVAAAFLGSSAGTSWSAFRALLVFHIILMAALAAGAWLGEHWLRTRLPLHRRRHPEGTWGQGEGAGFLEQERPHPQSLSLEAKERGVIAPALVWRRQIGRSATLASLPAVALALRALLDDPQAPWWSLAALVAVAVLTSAFGCLLLRRGLLHYAATWIVLAALGWWLYEGPKLVGIGTTRFLFGFAQIFVISLALPALVWTLLENCFFRPAGDLATRTQLPPVQRLAVRASLAVFGLLLAISLFADLSDESAAVSLIGQWLALAAIAVGATALLWDVRARDAVAMLYAMGLLAAGTLLDSLDLDSRWMLWLGTITLAAYALATSFLWSRRVGLRELGDLLHVPRTGDEPYAHLRWLVAVNCSLAAIVVALTFAIELTYAEASLRSLVSKTVLACAVAVGLLARGERRTNLQFAALALGAVWAIALAWSPLDPATTGGLLNRSVAVAAALGAIVVIYGVGFGKLLPSGSEWLSAALRIVPVLIVAAGGTLLFVLGTESAMFARHGEVVMAWPAIVLVALTLVGLSGAALAAALLPGRDPLGLSQRGRQMYVYAAEILLALCFVHIRLTMPWLFHGFFAQYWPIIVMLIAFLGAGVGEWFRRRGQTVLGDPLEKTGAMLPLLPVMAFWMLPTTRVDYSLLLLAVGLLFAGLSVARKSFGFGVLAAISANGGLWYFLNRIEGFRLLEHPQLWLIPPALCVLVAAHINRKQLTDAQLTTIRYACSMMVYVSSTADVFLNGVAQNPWLPVVLAAISLAGIFAGILFRIRAFLFLGVVFLLLALLTIIWHAAVDLDQTWLWYASGMLVGALIIVVFAVFEKKRDQVLRVIDELKQWQS